MRLLGRLLLLLCGGAASAGGASGGSSSSCHDWPRTCPGVVPKAPYKQTWLMNESTIIMPCNNTGFTSPTSTSGWGIVDFDWSNGKGTGDSDGWAKHSPMDDEEMLFEQVKMTTSASPGTTVWIYRNTVYAYAWYTSVRRKLEDPAYSDWFVSFKPKGPWFSKKCDSAKPGVCSDLYHSQEQSPGYPQGDGNCVAPGCDCGKVPCGFYVFNHSTTTIVNGQSFQDWFINDYVINEVGRSPLVSGYFWDDVWNADCNIHDQVKNTCVDMGFNCTPSSGTAPAKCNDPSLVKLTADYEHNMGALRNATLNAGKFAWQMLWTGGEDDSIGGTGLNPIVTKDACASTLRRLCAADSPSQTRAMAYGLSGSPNVRSPDFMQDLSAFLLTRGPYSWLGWGWKGCSQEYYWPPEFDIDYGVPAGLCEETAPGSNVFSRTFSKASVTLDCNAWEGNVKVKAEEERDDATLPHVMPPWEPTYNMSLSTIMMPCNYSGYMDPSFSAKWGLVDFDWSNAKQLWANSKPMDCQERLVEQAARVKEVSKNQTKVFVYRNLVKALPWYTSVREKLQDPAYAGFFLKFRDDGKPTRANPCTGEKCSRFYHDQDQTPEHPHGDGSCADECDCGEGIPCGEYLWDHRNGSMLRNFLIDEFVLGPTGVANENIDGVFLDDGWTDKPEKRASWWPKEGYCSADSIGGPTEEYPNCTLDMGLTQADTTALTAEWSKTIAEVQRKIVEHNGFNWQMFATTTDLMDTESACIDYFERECDSTRTDRRANAPWIYQFTSPKSGKALPHVQDDLAIFLLARGKYAYIGYSWIGCMSAGGSLDYYRPPELDKNYGKPLDGTCRRISSTQYERTFEHATASFDCKLLKGTITMSAPRQ